MDLHICVAQTTEAENVLPGDMVLTGDAGMGISLFLPVAAVLTVGLSVTLRFENAQEVTVKHDTEVIRLEQGDNPFTDGIGGVRTRGADRN